MASGSVEGKEKRKDAEEHHSDHTEDLCFGDIVTIYKYFSAPEDANSVDEDERQRGFLGTKYGGTIDNNLEVLSQETGTVSDIKRTTIPRNVRGCLFKIVPQLSYLEKAEGIETSIFKKEKSLEANANREEIQFKHGNPVKYGDTIQLQHVLTGKFVTIRCACSELCFYHLDQ